MAQLILGLRICRRAVVISTLDSGKILFQVHSLASIRPQFPLGCRLQASVPCLWGSPLGGLQHGSGLSPEGGQREKKETEREQERIKRKWLIKSQSLYGISCPKWYATIYAPLCSLEVSH